MIHTCCVEKCHLTVILMLTPVLFIIISKTKWTNIFRMTVKFFQPKGPNVKLKISYIQNNR